ncbi:hypothetical protein H70357_20685 [Paenibacillus sp. FSL H7-0357]|uniref:response regulator transcription factor n=1 Tax=Paenibacillus sp. FSL H7-0357 TaxID=1536774 RepID=UPI0004F88DD5|nr:response regulator [Paenibacillus sp. FSL H7-0357]AIQ18845.1 hypothetical protein H70357_20685 [Paenibacillus sp. FSL H7-0357]
MIGKLLVVDDEAWFREGLMKLISTNELGWEVVGEAADGEEALAAMELCTPDLVITDINMPVMDGLSLTERLSDSNPNVMVIILTGYREFEYAQRAVRYGAVEFLLKPFSLDEVYRVLRKAYEKFRLNMLEKKVRLKERQINLFRAALYGCPHDLEAGEACSREWAGFSFCILRVQSYYPHEKTYTLRDVGLLHYAVSNIIAELMVRHGVRGIWFPLRSEEFAFLLEPGPVAAAYQSTVRSTVSRYTGIQVCWLDGGILRQLDGLAAKYQKIGITAGGETPPDGMNPQRSYPFKEELLSLLITSNLQGVRERITAYLQKASIMDLQSGKTEVYTMMTAFSDILMDDFRHLKAAGYEALDPGAILMLRSVPELMEWAEGKGRDFIALFAQWLQEKQDNVVLRAKQYIDSHYRGVCTLQTVAGHVHVTPNYLSNLFKKETGIGFTSYVSQLRIERAKSLLAGTKLRMLEIAEESGFDNSSYFTTVFKQLTGKSPSEYRKQTGEGLID